MITGTVLREAGIDAIHVSKIEMFEAEDAEILQRAKEEERVVATLDVDFHTLLALNEATSPLVIRIGLKRAQAITDLLLMVIAECEDDLLQGVAVTVEPSCIRIRRLPLVPDV